MKGRIPAEFLAQLKERVNIADVVGEVVVLRKSGKNLSGLCPFHSERSPSFTVNADKGLYHCYGCKAGGDLIRFVMEIHGLSFGEAVEELADRGGLKLPETWSGGGENEDPEVARRRREAREKLEQAWKLNRFVLQFYQSRLTARGQEHIAKYFDRRGVRGDIARSFFIGAAPPGWDSLSRHLVEKKAPLPLAIELGLIRPSAPGRGDRVPGSVGHFDLFRNRALFPIIDLRGKVVGFGGRTVPQPGGPSGSGDEGPKYLNSSGSFVYHKDRIAFGLFQAAKHIREADEVILVEGYFDVVALHAAGFQNVVATCGTALTLEHLRLFRRFCSKITVLFDPDEAGIRATQAAMELGLEQGLVLYGANLPDDKDPDEILFNQEDGNPIDGGKEVVRGVLHAASPLLDARLAEQYAVARKDAESKTQAIRLISTWLKKFQDPVGRAVRLQTAARELAVPEAFLLKLSGGGEGLVSPPLSAGGPVQNRSPFPPRAGIQPPGAASRRPFSSAVVTLPAGPWQTPVEPAYPVDEAPLGMGMGGESGPPPWVQEGPSAPAPAAGRRREGIRKDSSRLGARDRILLSALAKGGAYSRILADFRGQVGPDLSFFELIDYFPARQFVQDLFQKAGYLERFRITPEVVLQEIEDAQLRSTLTEVLIATDPGFEEEDLKGALRTSARQAMERISQRMVAAIRSAEVKQDAGLEEKLKKDYLDLKRRIKEFNSFYDEAD